MFLCLFFGVWCPSSTKIVNHRRACVASKNLFIAGLQIGKSTSHFPQLAIALKPLESKRPRKRQKKNINITFLNHSLSVSFMRSCNSRSDWMNRLFRDVWTYIEMWANVCKCSQIHPVCYVGLKGRDLMQAFLMTALQTSSKHGPGLIRTTPTMSFCLYTLPITVNNLSHRSCVIASFSNHKRASITCCQATTLTNISFKQQITHMLTNKNNSVAHTQFTNN